MNNYTTALSVMTALALSMPMVCQAQDPLSSLNKVKALTKQGKTEDAVKLCDAVIKRYSGKGATSQQFGYVLPFYAWEKGVTYFKAGMYEEAYNAFKAFMDEPKWKEPSRLARAKENVPGQPEAYEPYFTYALFQMGNCRYKQGVGESGKDNGDKSKFDDAIACFEKYLKLIQGGKVSATEKKLKMDGQICFILVQSYILKEKPDFKKAAEYLEMSRKVKGRVPDEMAMEGLNTIVNVAISNPDNVGWVYKLIESSPASYNLDPARSARNANKFYNLGQRAYKVMDTALREGNDQQAADAARTANTLFGLVTDMPAARTALAAQVKGLGSYKKPVTDKGTGVSMSADSVRKLLENYKKLDEQGALFDGFSVLSSATIAKDMGSNRLAKGGYQLLYDRFGRLARPGKGEGAQPAPLRDMVIMQLGALCRLTGDDDAGLKYEKMLEGKDMGDQTKVLVFQKMSRAVSDKDWQNVIPAAEEVIEHYKNDKTNKLYLTARYMIVASHYQLGAYEEVIKTADELLASGEMVAAEGKDCLKPDQAANYDNYTYFFLMDACARLAGKDPAMRDKAIQTFEQYAAKYTTTDLKMAPLADKMYYGAVDQHLKRSESAADDKSAEEDKKMVIKYCDHICQSWPESDLYPTAELLAAGVLLNQTDDAEKAAALPRLQRAAEAGVKLNTKSGRATAANAYFWLASYSAEYPNEGESEEAAKARCREYAELFWKDGDAEGDPFALPMASLYLDMVKDKDDFEAVVKRVQSTIAREANYMFQNNKSDPELEKTINTYVDAYVNGNKNYLGKTLSLEEKTAHFTSFPGIDPADKYTQAIFRMAQINSMNQELVALKADKAAKEKMEEQIQAVFRDMTNTFKPADLTNYINVQVGDYLVTYVSKFPDPSSRTEELDQAVAYYDAVIERNRDFVADAELGKANALAFSKDAAKQAKSAELYTKVAGNPDPNVGGPALVGLTKLHLRTGNATAAVETANKYLQNRQNQRDRLDMMLMQGEAYTKANDSKNALLAYMNLFNQYKGKVQYSAKACLAIMEIFWKRNTPMKGDRLQKGFQNSDRWTAWNTGQLYVNLIRRSGVEAKLTPEEKDEFNKVLSAVHNYGTDPAVMKEDKANKEFQRNLQSSKKK
ncbi:MAG: hypothetical protein IKY92_00505 [Akkermansia sp.]|nr:hypothetical protein [Akkermansia sp.]